MKLNEEDKHDLLFRMNDVPNHKADGYSFQIFKQVYKKAKFGVIFTRAAPKNTRIDKEAFVQMIFSTALSLLKDAIQSMEKDDHLLRIACCFTFIIVFHSKILRS